MVKKFFKNCFVFLLCSVFVCGLACPVFADDLVSDLDYIYVGSFTFSESSFALTDDNYSVTFTPSGIHVENVSECAVSFDDEVVLLKWGKSNYASFPCFYIGNGALVDPAHLSDTGEAFVLALNREDKTQSKFVCTPDFFNQHIKGTGAAGFEITLSVPDNSSMTFLDRMFSVFRDCGDWLLSQISTLVSLFWNAASNELTFVGILSLISLGFSVIFLLIKVVLNFMHFRS